ncbi:hypothetical protein PYCC9005_000845 [Savitreella phatthalungensis]
MMEITFITMHDLQPACKILYASASITDVLGYQPENVIGQSTFDYFHPDDLPMALHQHRDYVELDRASVLSYVRVRNSDGEWMSCECVFSIAYDVIVAATTIYDRDSERSQGRALAVPVVQAAFSKDTYEITPPDDDPATADKNDSSVRTRARADADAQDRDPKYEMFAHMSSRFTEPNTLARGSDSAGSADEPEPRACFILNRYTHNMTIMYASQAAQEVLGIDPHAVVGKSFWECVDRPALDGCIDAIDRAKQNDSVAYMRFGWRNPFNPGSTSGAAQVDSPVDTPEDSHSGSDSPSVLSTVLSGGMSAVAAAAAAAAGTQTSAHSSRRAASTLSRSTREESTPSSTSREDVPQLDVEGILSCSSDGLILVLRRASPFRTAAPSTGLFAVPWSTIPLYAPPPSTDSAQSEMMDSIQQVGVFVWGLATNDEVVRLHARGTPGEGAVPSQPASSSSGTQVPGDRSRPNSSRLAPRRAVAQARPLSAEALARGDLSAAVAQQLEAAAASSAYLARPPRREQPRPSSRPSTSGSRPRPGAAEVISIDSSAHSHDSDIPMSDPPQPHSSTGPAHPAVAHIASSARPVLVDTDLDMTDEVSGAGAGSGLPSGSSGTGLDGVDRRTITHLTSAVSTDPPTTAGSASAVINPSPRRVHYHHDGDDDDVISIDSD